jgi:anthranilate synthase component 2
MESCRSFGKYDLEVKTPAQWLKGSQALYDKVIISPGPGLPKESNGLYKAIEKLWGEIPLLGVCLGLQAIVEFRGGALERSEQPYHGLDSQLEIVDKADPLYRSITDPCIVGRYHSWRINRSKLPREFIITSQDDMGAIMSIRHRELPVFGVQYHPESYISQQGKRMIHNFMEL